MIEAICAGALAMVVANDKNAFEIRPIHYKDLEPLKAIAAQQGQMNERERIQYFQHNRLWYALVKTLSRFRNPLQHLLQGFVTEPADPNAPPTGFIRVAPFNINRTTWRVEQLLVSPDSIHPQLVTDPNGIGSQLLRHCFQNIWEARTWVLEVDVNEKSCLALYRQNGFQPLAHLTHWSITPNVLTQLAANSADLPNLLPVGNADAALLCQLDCVSMPPLMRQVFDRHIPDFKQQLLPSLVASTQRWYGHQEQVAGYVFEPQRKAAIGYFKLTLNRDELRPHEADLTVHPAYTWLYPKLLIHMAQLVQAYPGKSLKLQSADYQHEREEYLEQLGANREAHHLLMSRSVWHKLKETKPERMQLSGVLQGLQPVPRAPIPSRISLLNLPLSIQENPSEKPEDSNASTEENQHPHSGHQGSSAAG